MGSQKKKSLHEKMPQFYPDFDVISKTKKKVFHILISQCHFDGPSEANGTHDEPLKSMSPGVIVPAAPPLVGPGGG